MKRVKMEERTALFHTAGTNSGQLAVSSRSAHCLSVKESILCRGSNASFHTNEKASVAGVEASAGNAC